MPDKVDKKRVGFTVWLVATSLGAVLSGCAAEGDLGTNESPVEAGDGGLPYYGEGELPQGGPELFNYVRVGVLEASCQFAGCHDGSPETASGLDLRSDPRSALLQMSTAVRRPLVVPGAPERSYLMEKLTSATPEAGKQMPPGKPLGDDQLEAIRRWIENGAVGSMEE